MSEPRANAAYSSPMEEVYAWMTPNSLKRKDQVSKRKCNDDSGYVSPFSTSKSRLNVPVTPVRSSELGYHSVNEVSTPYINSNHTFKKRLINSHTVSQEEKCSSHNCTLPGVDTYSEFLMDASLYTEPMETNTDTSSLCMIVEEKEVDSLSSIEVCKTIDINLTANSENFATPNASSLFKTPMMPLKSTSSSKKKSSKHISKRISRSRCLHGFEKVDLFFQLGGKANHSLVISKILGYLSDSDIANMTMVSKTWKNVCLSDPKVKARWLNYIADRKERKENLGVMFCKMKSQLTPLLNRNHSTPLHTRQAISPPVSPSKVRFRMFQKEASRLKDDEILMQCPRCRHPSACSLTDSLGECKSTFCQLRFCTICKGGEHIRGICPTLTPNVMTSPAKRSSSVGSKQSKRYLRRL